MVGGVATGCGRASKGPPCERRADHSVVACFDGDPVTAVEVGEFTRAAGPVDGSAALPSPQRQALEAALRVRVFAAEAVRRKLDGGNGRDPRSRAQLHQALIHDETERAGATAAQVPLDEARRHYEARPGDVNKVTGTWVRAIFTAQPAEAEAAYREAVGKSEEEFAAIAQRMSVDPSAAGGGDLGEAHAQGIDPAVRRLANDLRAAGDVKGPAQTSDGQWVVLRATRVEVKERPFDEAARDVQHLLAKRREAALLDALYAKLAGAHRIVVFDDEVARLPPPVPRAPLPDPGAPPAVP